MLATVAILLTARGDVWLDRLIERDRSFADSIFERVVACDEMLSTTVEYVQVGGLAHAETKTTDGSKPDLTSWFAYGYQIDVSQFRKEDGKYWGEVESYTKLKPSVTIDQLALLVIGGMGISGKLDLPRRSPHRAQWDALSSVGLGVSLMQLTSVRTSKDMLTVTGTVPGVGTFEYVFETGKSLKPKSLSRLSDENQSDDRYFVGHETVDGVVLANMSVMDDETTYLKSVSRTVPESKTHPIDWFDEGTLLMSFAGCNVRTRHYLRIVKDLGHKPKSTLDLIANCFPHLAKKD